MKRAPFSVLIAAAVLLLSGCEARQAFQPPPADPERLHQAMARLTDVIMYDILSPPQASRVYAYASIAAYEALPHEGSRYPSLVGQLQGLTAAPSPAAGEEVYRPLSSVYAFLTVGKALTFSQARMEANRKAAVEEFRKSGIPPKVIDSSVRYGDEVASHILAWAKTDHFAQTRGYERYTVTDEPGRWVPTAPAYLNAVEPNWGKIRPFTLDSASQFRPAPPPPFDTTAGAPFYRQVRAVWKTGRELTPEQRAIAAFWDCNPYVMNLHGHVMVFTKKVSPGGHWMGITGIASRQSGADLTLSARAYAEVSVAVADGFLSAWEEKYRSNLVRPESVIRAGMDSEWEPLLQTPPFPEYPSGHSVISNAAAEVLTSLFGEPFAFADSTESRFGLPTRSFGSFREAAAEAAISRLYGGIHYPMSVQVGLEEGKRVGRQVVERLGAQRVTAVVRGRDAS
jgi:hypothetical protein